MALKHVAPVLRPMAVLTVSLLVYWVFNLAVLPQGGQSANLVSVSVSALSCCAIAFAAQRCPGVFTQPLFTVAAIAVFPLGAFFIQVGQASGMEPVALMGIGLVAAGICWIDLYAALSFAGLGAVEALFAIAVSYLLTHVFCLGIGQLDLVSSLMLLAVLPLALFFLAHKKVGAFLEHQASHEPPSDLSVTNPYSFVPITSRFFVFFFLSSFVCAFMFYGDQAATLQKGTGTFATVMALAPGAILLGYWLCRHQAPTSGFLFTTISLFMVASLLITLVLPSPNMLGFAYGIAKAGSEFYGIFFFWCVLILVGSRNDLAILPSLAWGRTIIVLGGLGALLLRSALAALPAVSQAPALSATTALLTFVYVAYNMVMLSSFDFDRMTRSMPAIEGVSDEPESAEAPEAPCAPGQDHGPSADDQAAVRAVLATMYGLTTRELDVFNLLARGRNCAHIQEALDLTRNTVKTHTRNIYAKLCVHTQQELMDLAEELARGE